MSRKELIKEMIGFAIAVLFAFSMMIVCGFIIVAVIRWLFI